MSHHNNRQDVFFQFHISDQEIIPPDTSNREAEEKHEWGTPTRTRVKTLQQVGWTRNAIEKDTGVPERTQQSWLSQGYRRPGKKRCGRPKKLSKRCLSAIIRHVSRSFENRKSTWQYLAEIYSDNCSASTVKPAMNSIGYYKCRACQMTWLSDDNVDKRLAFAKEYTAKSLHFWRTVRFTDEVHFSMESRAAAWVIRTNEERYDPTCIQYKRRGRRSQLHAWAMVGYNYKSPFVFFDSNDTSEPTDWIYEVIGNEHDDPQPTKETETEEAQLLGNGRPSTCKHRCKNKGQCKHACCKADYRSPKVAGNMTMEQYLTKIFRPYIEPAWLQAKEQHRGFVLLEDNDGSHGTKTSSNIVAKYKAAIGIPWYANSPRSPDLNVIENVWRILKQRLKQALSNRTDLTIDKVKDLIQQIWRDIDQKEINQLVVSMPERLKECVRRKGVNTPF